MADTIARALASQAKNLALGTTNGETVDARTGADTVARASLGAFVRELHQKTIDHDAQIVNPAASTTATLQHGLNVVSPLNASILTPNISGRTLVNLLGRDGNFEKDTVTDGIADGWSGVLGGATATLDTTNFKYGSKGQKIASNVGDSSTLRTIQKIVSLSAGKYYLALIDAITDGTSTALLMPSDGTVNLAQTTTTTSKVLYKKWLQGADTTNGAIKLMNFSSLGVVGWVSFDGARLYEITQAEYNLIDVDPNYTGDKLADKYPYCDDVKHVVNPMLTKQGKNLLPPFTEWTLHANAVVTEPYKLTLNATGSGQGCYAVVNVIPNTDYTIKMSVTSSLSGADSAQKFAIYNLGGTSSIAGYSLMQSDTAKTFNTGNNTQIQVYVSSNNTAGSNTYTFTNPQLELGSTATTFEPQNIDYVYGASDSAGKPLTLAASLDGTVKDSLYYRDGKWLKEKRWVTDVVLDGTAGWSFFADSAGYKQFITPSPAGIVANSTKLVSSKYDGKVLTPTLTLGISAADQAGIGTLNVLISAADTDTGFAETFTTPSPSDIAAYFNGWKMSDSAFAAYSTGTKYWTAVDSPKADFAGKVAASVVENANIAKYNWSALLTSPTGSWSGEVDYTKISYLDGSTTPLTTSTNTVISQHLFSFNLIEHVLRKYGSAVFGAAVTTVDRVAWLKANVGKVAANWFGYGSGPAGNKASFTVWNANTSAWGDGLTTNTASSVSKLSITSTSATVRVDSNGFVHFLAYADAAGPMVNPTVAPTLSASGSGSGLGAGTYFVAYTWTAAGGETLMSPEASITITAGQNIVVTAPSLPIGATGIGVYISTTTGTETKQGTSASNTYTQTAALVTGALASSNTAIAPSTINTDFVELEVNLLVQTLPTGYATTSWTPYKLSYQLATTTEEAVIVEGAVNLHSGGNQIEVSEGVVVREKVTPVFNSGQNVWEFNRPDSIYTASKFKNRVSQISGVYANGIALAKQKWASRITPYGQANTDNGPRFSLTTTDYDATAEYTVTYTMLDKYANTAAVKDVTGDYQTTTKMILDHVVRRLADDETQLTVNIAAIAQLYKRVKALGG